MNTICPNCEAFRKVEIIRALEETAVKGDSITAEVVYSKCSACSEEFSTPEQMDESLENAYQIYRENHRLIHPEQIVAIRKKYSISQKAFARILGFGELTINSYEQGAVPTKVSSNLIKLMKDTEVFLKLYEINREELSPAQQKKTDAKLKEILCDEKEWDKKVDQIYRLVKRKTTALAESEKSVYEVTKSFSDAVSQKLSSKQ